MMFRNEMTVHKDIIPGSSFFYSGAVKDCVIPISDVASVSTRFWKIRALEEESIAHRRNSQVWLIERCHATTQKSGVWI